MSHFFLGDIIFDIANKERGVLVVKLGPSNCNYWKRTGKACQKKEGPSVYHIARAQRDLQLLHFHHDLFLPCVLFRLSFGGNSRKEKWKGNRKVDCPFRGLFSSGRLYRSCCCASGFSGTFRNCISRIKLSVQFPFLFQSAGNVRTRHDECQSDHDQ